MPSSHEWQTILNDAVDRLPHISPPRSTSNHKRNAPSLTPPHQPDSQPQPSTMPCLTVNPSASGSGLSSSSSMYRASVPASMAHLLIDAQPGNVVTGVTSPRPLYPATRSLSSASSPTSKRPRFNVQHDLGTRSRSGSPSTTSQQVTLRHGGNNTSMTIRPRYPGRAVSETGLHNPARRGTPTHPASSAHVRRRPQLTLPRLTQSDVASFPGSVVPATAPPPTTKYDRGRVVQSHHNPNYRRQDQHTSEVQQEQPQSHQQQQHLTSGDGRIPSSLTQPRSQLSLKHWTPRYQSRQQEATISTSQSFHPAPVQELQHPLQSQSQTPQPHHNTLPRIHHQQHRQSGHNAHHHPGPVQPMVPSAIHSPLIPSALSSVTHPPTPTKLHLPSTSQNSRAWFALGTVPRQDMSRWPAHHIQLWHQGFDAAVQAVTNGVLGVGDKQFANPSLVMPRPKRTTAGSPQRADSASLPVSQSASTHSQSRTLSSGTVTFAPGAGQPVDPRPPTAPQSITPSSFLTSNPRIMRTHPPPHLVPHPNESYLGPPLPPAAPPPHRPPAARSKRQAISCFPCRQRRLKCSGDRPACIMCLKRKIPEKCAYAEGIKRRGKAKKSRSQGSGESPESTAIAADRARKRDGRMDGRDKDVREDVGGYGGENDMLSISPETGASETFRSDEMWADNEPENGQEYVDEDIN